MPSYKISSSSLSLFSLCVLFCEGVSRSGYNNDKEGREEENECGSGSG